MSRIVWVLAVFLWISPVAAEESRPPPSEQELKSWLENMVWYHGFTGEEIQAAIGLSQPDIDAALQRFDIRPATRPARGNEMPLLVLPYPGGRHPRIGFLDGAVDPQRDTKISVFLPWDQQSYVVVDLPEAIWSNLGLTYLAHTHVPTIWSKDSIQLERLEWQTLPSGEMEYTRRLPNGIAFGAHVTSTPEVVRMELWLKNGTDQLLSDLRVQNCVMLKGAAGFTIQSNDNKVIRSPYVCCRNESGSRWIITGWEPCHRPWANPPCPCLHSDPKFPDCKPGETVHARGILTFHEGTDLDAKLAQLDRLKWQEK